MLLPRIGEIASSQKRLEKPLQGPDRALLPRHSVRDPEAFSNLLRFSRYQRKLRIRASLLENLGALSSCLSAFSISARSSLRLPLVS
jgi:hypothetical protein